MRESKPGRVSAWFVAEAAARGYREGLGCRAACEGVEDGGFVKVLQRRQI